MHAQYLDDSGFGVSFAAQNSSGADFVNHQDVVRRAYYGCISYVDGLIGDLLAALKAVPGAESETAVVFTGDQ